MRKIIPLRKGINNQQLRIKLKEKLNQEINLYTKEELNNTEISPLKTSISKKENKLSESKLIQALMIKLLLINIIEMQGKNNKVLGNRLRDQKIK